MVRLATKIAIIGAGPGGLMAAIEGAKAGLEVSVFEASRVGDNIRCAEGFLDFLKILGEPEAGVRMKIEAIDLEVKQQYTLDISKNNILWMIDRREWQIHLARQAQALGVKLLEFERISVARLPELQQEFDWVIDASGVPSVTSRALGFRDYYKEYGSLTVQYVLEGDFSRFDRRIKLGLASKFKGYYWVFPKGWDTANVGVGYFDIGKFPDAGKILWDDLRIAMEKEGLSDYRVVRKMGGVCPVKFIDRPVYGNIILVGDAAGLTSPLHGGGIDLACISGKIAAQCIAAGRVADYRQRVWQVVGGKLTAEQKLYELWDKIDFDTMDTIIKVATLEMRKLGWRDLIRLPGVVMREFDTLRAFFNGFVRGSRVEAGAAFK